jgi:hypothetical protein
MQKSNNLARQDRRKSPGSTPGLELEKLESALHRAGWAGVSGTFGAGVALWLRSLVATEIVARMCAVAVDLFKLRPDLIAHLQVGERH